METVLIRQKMLDAGGIHLDLLDGAFDGKTEIADLKHVHVEGEVSGFDARKSMRVYDGESLPWDAAAAGPVQLRVTFGLPRTFWLQSHMTIAPKGTGAPVHGSLDGTYDATAETLDLGTSWLALPSTRLDFSGVLGRQLRVRADSRNLDDILPAFGVESLPVKLQNGEAAFDGSITGKLADPRIIGHAKATGVVWSGQTFDAVSGDIDLTSAGLSVRNGSLQQGALLAQGSGSLGMNDWKVEDSSPIAFTGSIHNAPAAQLMAIADIKNVPVEGTIGADGKIAGTIGAPRIEANVAATKGTLAGETFDRFTGRLTYAGATMELANAHIAAGGKNAALQASYRHQAGNFGNGQLRFQVDTNAMPLAQFQLVSKDYPGINGTAELHGGAVVDIAPAKAGEPGFRLVRLDGTLAGRGLRINDQTLRDATLTAVTKGSELSAHFESELAGSAIQGEGKWSLAGDYPGGAQLSFKNLDLERLRLWLRGRQPPGGMHVTGAAEGTLAIEGPAIKPDLWKAELRIPSLAVGPGTEVVAGRALALHNQGPIVVRMERDVIKVESARMVGQATDLSLTGSINLQQKSALDLRVNGRFDLASSA